MKRIQVAADTMQELSLTCLDCGTDLPIPANAPGDWWPTLDLLDAAADQHQCQP